MQITLLAATASERTVFANLLQLYLYDSSEFTNADVNQDGCFVYPYLDSYWAEAERHPFLIQVAGQLAGFALVNRYSRLLDPFDGHAVAEFFVLRKYRRMGVGRAAAFQLFDRFPGRWEVASVATNVPAHAFWRSVIDMYTGGRYHELWLQDASWRGPVQSFVASPNERRNVGSSGCEFSPQEA